MIQHPRLPLALPLLLALIAGCGGEAPEATPEQRAPVDVELAAAELAPLSFGNQATGSVRALRQVSPGTKILGRVDSVEVREGERVRRGQLLARLESRDLEAAVTQAEAAVTMAEAQLENATAQRDRMTALFERGSATEKNLEDAVAGYRVAAASLEQAEANLAAAEVMLSYAEIRSPIAGWMVEKRIEAGDMASPGAPLFVIEDLSRVEVEVQVPEAEIVDLQVGQEARVTILDEERSAVVDRIVQSGDPASRTFTVKLVLDNPEGRLRSGMFARVAFAGDVREVLTVPRSALVQRGQLDGIFVADDDGVLRLRWVKLGRTRDDRVEILSGLEPGARYVVDPPSGLVDGVPYRGGAS